MLARIAAKLDAWIVEQNLAYRDDGMPLLRPCRIRLLGLQLNATNDVDVYADYEHAVKAEFQRLLAKHGKELDPVGHEVWMPEETEYHDLFQGEYVTMQVADVDSVLLSKALKAPWKNRPLIVEYLAEGASARFLAMAERYNVDLEQFL